MVTGPAKQKPRPYRRGFAIERMALRERNTAKETAPVRETRTGSTKLSNKTNGCFGEPPRHDLWHDLWHVLRTEPS